MRIELRRGIFLYPGTFYGVIAPEKVLIDAINGTRDLARFRVLWIGRKHSRLLPEIRLAGGNFGTCHPATAHDLFAAVRKSGHTVIVTEHDPGLFTGAEKMIGQVAGALRQAGHGSLVIYYAPFRDRIASHLLEHADRTVEIVAPDGLSFRDPPRAIRLQRTCGHLMAGQTTLETS